MMMSGIMTTNKLLKVENNTNDNHNGSNTNASSNKPRGSFCGRVRSPEGSDPWGPRTGPAARQEEAGLLDVGVGWEDEGGLEGGEADGGGLGGRLLRRRLQLPPRPRPEEGVYPSPRPMVGGGLGAVREGRGVCGVAWRARGGGLV